MIEEAINAISALTEEARCAKFLRADAEPPHVYYVVKGDKAERVEALPANRAHEAHDLASLVACTRRLSSADSPASVWVSRHGVAALLDDDDRRDRVVLKLPASPQMRQLAAWSGEPKWLAQTELVRVLRNVFPRSARRETVAIFRQLKFNLTASGETVAEHGRASAGRQLEAKVSGASAIPEDMTFKEPAFDGGALAVEACVPCTVEIDTKNERFAICPVAGSVEAAWQDAEEALARKVRDLLGEGSDDHISVYLGTP